MPRVTSPRKSSFDYDPALAALHLAAADKKLARLIERVGPCSLEPKPTTSVFASLAESIVYQQLTGKAAATIYARVLEAVAATKRGPTAAHIHGASDAALRGAGLSGNKLLALRDLARRADAGEIPTLARAKRMSDQELIERLTLVRGIGQWTVEMLLIFGLGRADVLPVSDYGVRKGYALTFGKSELPTPKELGAHGERWAPYRTVASWYLWRALDTDSGRAASQVTRKEPPLERPKAEKATNARPKQASVKPPSNSRPRQR